jgi:hypothetical protein
MREKNKEKGYQYLIEHFGEEKIRERMAFLIKTANILIESREVEEYVFVNKKLIEQIVHPWF